MDLRRIKTTKRKKCSVCGKDAEICITLPNYPITETYLDKKIPEDFVTVDQAFQYCPRCGHGQLETIIRPDVLYSDEMYKFRTTGSGSSSNNDSYIKIIEKELKKFPFKRIVEVGCNDGYLLRKLKDKCKELVGIDPLLNEKDDGNIKYMTDFIENISIDLSDTLVITNQVLEHIEDPKKFISNMLKMSNENTVFLFQFPSLNLLLDNGRFDQIYHHHQHYFSQTSFYTLLKKLKCEVISFDWNPYYWGSMIVAFKKGNMGKSKLSVIEDEYIIDKYEEFLERMTMGTTFLYEHKDEGIYGYGAGLQIPILNYYMPIDDDIKYIIDDSKEKDGLYLPGMKSKIVHSKDIDINNKLIFITAPSYSREIIKNICDKKPWRIYDPFNSI